jgi:phosphatidylglycerophosphatase C
VTEPNAGAWRTVAAFDFDGTLTRHDSLLPFLARIAGWPRAALAFGRVAPRLARASRRSDDRDAAKERLLVHLLAGRPYRDVEALGEAYGRALVTRAIRPGMRRLVQWHRAQGHDVVIVSASLDVYLHPVARQLDAHELLCTRLEVDEHGACTGRMLGGNCRGPGKAARLREYLGAEPVTLWAYGDSAGDDEMLAMADHPVRARRGRLRSA